MQQFATVPRCQKCGGAMSAIPGSVHYCDQFAALERGATYNLSDMPKELLEQSLSADLWDPIKKLQAQVAEKLAQGIPVTLSYDGKPLYTMYPGGKTEYHHGSGFGR